MRELVVLFMILICVAFTCGCTSPTASRDSQPTATPPPATQVTTQGSFGPTKTVSMVASSFDPAILNIQTGTTVSWINKDRTSRRVVHAPTEATGRIQFQSEALYPGDTYSYTFNTPGRYIYGDPQHGEGHGVYLVIVS